MDSTRINITETFNPKSYINSCPKGYYSNPVYCGATEINMHKQNLTTLKPKVKTPKGTICYYYYDSDFSYYRSDRINITLNEYESITIYYISKYTRMLNENERNLETVSKYYVDLSFYRDDSVEIYYTINATSLSSFSIENNVVPDEFINLWIAIFAAVGGLICWNLLSLLCLFLFRCNIFILEDNGSICSKPTFCKVPLWFILLACMMCCCIFPVLYCIYTFYGCIKACRDKCKERANRRDLYAANYQPSEEESKEVVEDDHLEEEKEAINPLPVSNFYPNFTNINEDLNNETLYSEINDGDMALPVFKVKDDCAFCHDSMNEENENIKNTECGHRFHFDCFAFYAKLKAKNGKIACALCRREVKV